MLRLATLTLAVLSSAVPALSKVSCKDPGPSACKQQCSAYRKQRPAPRMSNACLAGCNAGRSVHANCGAACKNQQHRQEKAEKDAAAAAAAKKVEVEVVAAQR